MKHIVHSVHYKGPSDVDWTSMGMVPGHGTLSIETAHADTGIVQTYKLSASLLREERAGKLPAYRDMKLMVVLDSGDRIFLGTDELPVRLAVQESDTITVSCSWKKGI